MPNVRKKRAQSKRYYIQNRVFADILGIVRYFACSKLMPNSTTQHVQRACALPIFDDKWQMYSCQ